MNREELDEILGCLTGGRTLFHYFPDRYAIYLLDRYLRKQGPTSIRELRTGKHAKLLSRPILQDVIKRSGDGQLGSDELAHIWPETSQTYVLTLGRWGQKQGYRWAQTSRPGSNLVLQLNLSERWAGQMKLLLNDTINGYMCSGHPVSEKRSATLAWARLDLDMATGVVLIEEIQSDLVKELQCLKQWAQNSLQNDQPEMYLWNSEQPICSKTLLNVTQSILDEISHIWHEAMLTAAIWFCFEELGMNQIYFHSFETGCVLKNLRYCKPPRSLYTQIPRKFCFEKTDEGPHFVVNDKHAKRRLKKAKEKSWFVTAA